MLQAGPTSNNRYSLTMMKILTEKYDSGKIRIIHIACSASVVTKRF